MPKRAGADGERGTIRRRGNPYQVRVKAGFDPVTSKELVLTGTAPTEAEARDLRRRLLVELDDELHARSKATFRVAMEKWLRVHEIDDSTRESYQRYARLHLYPTFGDHEPADRSALARTSPLHPNRPRTVLPGQRRETHQGQTDMRWMPGQSRVSGCRDCRS